MRRLLFITSLLAFSTPAFAQVSFQPQVHGLGCLQPSARAMVAHIVQRIGAIQITSTCGGRHARHSMHYRGLAVDFRPRSVSPARAAQVLHSMPEISGIGTYRNGLIHADVGGSHYAGPMRGVRRSRRR